MTKFKKIVSGTLAGCLIASALMMSAGAANVQTYIPSGTVQAAAQTTTLPRTAVKINPQSADNYAEGIPATYGQKYLVGRCIAHGVPVGYYGKVVSVCG